MKLITETADINKAITGISVAGKKLDDTIQLVGLSVLNHIELHGDVTLANKLFLAMPRGARKAALTGWYTTFGKLVANTGDNKKEAPFVYAKEKTTDLAGASQNPWYSFAPDKEPDEIADITAMLNALIKRASKAKTVTDPELLAKLTTLVNAE